MDLDGVTLFGVALYPLVAHGDTHINAVGWNQNLCANIRLSKLWTILHTEVSASLPVKFTCTDYYKLQECEEVSFWLLRV